MEANECAAELDSGAALDGDGGKCEPASEEVRVCFGEIFYPGVAAVEEELRIGNYFLLLTPSYLVMICAHLIEQPLWSITSNT